MPSLVSQSQVFFHDEAARALGRLTLAGTIKGSAGLDPRQMRVLGRYALVLVTEGSGTYRDVQGLSSPINTGDAILVFPEIAHEYGPRPGEFWDEIYVCFDGPLFDLWRATHFLEPSSPIHHVAQPEEVFERIRALCAAPRPADQNGHAGQLTAFMSILVETLSFYPQNESDGKAWLNRSKAVLEANLAVPDVTRAAARAAGRSPDYFRRVFTQETGVSPTRYRDLKRIEAAKTLLERAELTNAVIARSLGYGDEGHFSKRFKQLTGLTPREFRRGVRDDAEGKAFAKSEED